MMTTRTRPGPATLHCLCFGALVITSAMFPGVALAQLPDSSLVEAQMIVNVTVRGIELSGTLTLPTTGPGPLPAALLIPQRDGHVPPEPSVPPPAV